MERFTLLSPQQAFLTMFPRQQSIAKLFILFFQPFQHNANDSVSHLLCHGTATGFLKSMKHQSPFFVLHIRICSPNSDAAVFLLVLINLVISPITVH